MITYIVCDIEGKKQYIGSTESVETGRPWSHLNGNSSNPEVARVTAKRNCFVFVSVDDGLNDRSEEQHYLDFNFGAKWSMNHSRHATGNPQAIKDYNEKVRSGELPHSWDGLAAETREQLRQESKTRLGLNSQDRLKDGTHNFLSENRDPEVEERRLESVKAALEKRNSEELAAGTHPFQDAEVRQRAAEGCKNMSHRFRKFGQKPKNPEQTSKRQKEAHARNKDKPETKENKKRANRVSYLSRYGFNGVFPAAKEFSSSLSETFVLYYSHFGSWQ